ncbi:MAG: glycosyltransferase [Methylococcaceae bacterium]|nr:glycosyltransferase [Methylococcaceae bacterium]
MNPSSPLVSIVVPAYNHARYLAQAIDSILGQDYPNLELIVLDDGSTDNTSEVLESYVNCFYWETHQNMGQANTLNKGWRMAKGEILAYLSADDILFPQSTRVSVECLLKNADAVLCYCDFQLIDPESRVVRNVTAPEYSYIEMVTNFICAPGPGAFFRRNAFLITNGWDSKLRQFPDYAYWLQLGLLGRFVHIRQQLAAFRIHEESQTFAQTTIERSEEALRIIENYFQLPNIPAEVVLAKNQSVANATLLVAQLHLRSGRYRMGFHQISKAFQIFPQSLISFRILKILINGFFNRFVHKLLWKIRKKHG